MLCMRVISEVKNCDYHLMFPQKYVLKEGRLMMHLIQNTKQVKQQSPGLNVC